MAISRQFSFQWALLLFLFSLQVNLITSYSLNNYVITDLTATALTAAFITDANTWTGQVASATIYQSCGGTPIVGGPSILGNGAPSYQHYFYQTYSGLPTHKMIHYSLSFWMIGSWDAKTSDTAQIYFDSKMINTWSFQWSGLSNFCGGVSNGDFGAVRILGTIFHSASSLLLKFISLLNEASANESFGFRDIRLLLVNNPEANGEERMCGRPANTALYSYIYTNLCTCPTGQYEKDFLGSGACFPCHTNCNECFGPSATECYTCSSGKTFNGHACITACHPTCSDCFGDLQTQCLSCQAGWWLANNYTCVTSCDLPLLKSLHGTVNKCDSPCPDNEFAYWNGSCFETCPFPLLSVTTIAGHKLCQNPCPGSYLHYDQTCEPDCPIPWSIRIEGDVQYCDYPCETNQVLYWNGSCQTDCLFPLQQRFDVALKFCDYPCLSTEYLFPNSACMDACSFPLKTNVQYNRNFCEFPCRNSKFVYWNGTCSNSCPSPFIINAQSIGNLCEPPCGSSAPFFNTASGLCTATCDGIPSSDSSGLFQTCDPKYEPPGFFEKTFLIASSEPEERSFLNLVKPLQYVKYIDVNASSRFDIFRFNNGKSILSLRYGWLMSNETQVQFPKYELPSAFEKAGCHSNFIVNYWLEFTSFGIMLLVLVGLLFAEKLFEKLRLPTLQNIIGRLRVIVKWNFFLILLGTGVDEIILATILQFKTFYFDSFISIFSLLLALFIVGVVVAFVADILYLIPKAKAAKDDALLNGSYDHYLDFLIQWQDYQVYFRGFKDDDAQKQHFFLIYIGRLCLPMLIVCLIYEIPLMQTILLLLINIIFLIYIISKRPIRRKVNFIQLIISETITLVINFSLFIVSILDVNNAAMSSNAGIFFADVVIIGNLCLNILAMGFLALKVYQTIKSADQYDESRSDMKKAILLQILYLPFQQGGFGFELVQLASFLQGEEQSLGETATSTRYQEMKQKAKKKEEILGGGKNDIKIQNGNEYFDELDDEVEVFGKVENLD